MKNIYVIGAGKGLGNGVAEKFARNGFKVILMARNAARLESYVKEFAAKGIEVFAQAADVSDFKNFAETFKNAVEKFGAPDVLFFNVGITAPDDKNKMNAQTLVEHYITDVAAAFNCIQLVDTKEFSERHGAILITGGGLAITPYADYLPLSMDKAALRAMVQALTPVLNAKGIYIGTVQVTGNIGSNEHFAPLTIAEKFFKLYEKRETNEIIY